MQSYAICFDEAILVWESWKCIFVLRLESAITEKIRECSRRSEDAAALMLPTEPLKSTQQLSSDCVFKPDGSSVVIYQSAHVGARKYKDDVGKDTSAQRWSNIIYVSAKL